MCPAGKSLDSSRKKCIDNNESSNSHFGGIGSEDVQGRSRMPDDTYHPDSNDWKDSHYDLNDHYHHHHYHHEQTLPEMKSESGPVSSAEPEPVSSAAPATEANAEPNSELSAEAAAEPTAEPTSVPAGEPSAEPTVQPAAEPTARSTIDPSAESSAEPNVEPAAEPSAHLTPEPSAEPTVQPAAEPTARSTIEPNAEPAAEPSAESTAEPSAEPVAEPSAEPAAEPSAEAAAKPIAEPNPEPTSEPAAKPSAESTAQPATEPTARSTIEPNAEPAAEPSAEPAAEPSTEQAAEPNAEPAAEPSAQLTPESSAAPVTEANAEPSSERSAEAAAEPIAEPTTEPTSVPASEPSAEPAVQPAAEPTTRSTIEPNAEPAAEPSAESPAEPSAEPAAEPSAEPAAEPNAESAVEPSTEPAAESTSVPAAEPSAEPTVQPATEPTARSVIEPSAEPAAEPKAEPAAEPSAESAAEPKAEPAAEPVAEPSPEPATTLANEPATVIGLIEKQPLDKPVPTEVNNENQFVTEKPLHTNNQTQFENLLNAESVKKGPRLDKDEQDTANPLEEHVKDVVTSHDMTQENNTNVSANDFHNSSINSSSSTERVNVQKMKDISEKNDLNPEEQYNDITDDFVPKGFGKNDIELTNEERKIQKIYKENKNINYTKSKADSESSDKLALKSTTPAAVEITEKRIEDPNVTSQVPILPIEIQLDMSTTENVDKAFPQTTPQVTEKEITSTSSPKMTIAEGKTTEQIPILPEELQTTMMNKQEHSTESTLSDEKDKKSKELLAAYHKKDEFKDDESVKSTENNSPIESTTLKETVDGDSIEQTTIYSMPTEGSDSSKDTVKPVFESITDDTTPQTFEYRYLLTTTTTENPDLLNNFEEMTEEQLRVIPLEEKKAYKSPLKTDDQTKFKKEKELSFKTPNDQENGNNVDKKSSRTVEDDNIPKLISGGSSDVEANEELKTIFISPDFDSSKSRSVIPPKEQKINPNDNVKYPNFIPVSEEIDESDYHTVETTHSPLDNHHDIATDLPELLSSEEKNKENERETKESTTELLQAVESTTNKTLLLEKPSTENKDDDNEKQNVEKATTEENKVLVSSTAEPDQSEFSGIPVAIVTSEQDAPQQTFFSKCKSGQFQCVNGTSRDGSYCVDLSSTCDSENDCSDGSDEFECEKKGCPGNFQCASGQCLKRNLVCNGIVDCDDGSDEKECSDWKCESDEFQCPNGRCIPVLWQCDGRPDCENHADEYSCSESCGNDEYLCPTEKWCIPQTWRCNGVAECVSGEDEKLCECAVDQFKCETGGCIPTEQLCDGVENCPDRSDEWNCLSGFSKNSSISTDVDKENKENEFSTKSSPVKIRQSNGEQRYICSDGWTDAFSDQYCRSLGFAASEATQLTEVGTDKKLLQLISNANPNSSIVLNLEKTDSCKTEKIVEISCQEFSCGSHESVGPTARLVGGTPATEGQWSSVALLKEPKYGTACTASVLSPMHALASYSCIYSNRQSSGWQLFVGGNLLKPNKVKNIVPYPQVKYNQFLYNNDIALVELAEPLVFSRNVSAACLPNQLFQPPQLCVTVGWGFPLNGEVDLQQYLKFLPVPTYNSEECNATSHYAGFITKNNICAGFTDTDKGPCYNDEGAPLMCVSETGRWEIQGLLSHHSRCSRGHPAIYSSLAPALSWLRNSVPALQSHT